MIFVRPANSHFRIMEGLFRGVKSYHNMPLNHFQYYLPEFIEINNIRS